jgi:hypothetical protein
VSHISCSAQILPPSDPADDDYQVLPDIAVIGQNLQGKKRENEGPDSG